MTGQASERALERPPDISFSIILMRRNGRSCIQDTLQTPILISNKDFRLFLYQIFPAETAYPAAGKAHDVLYEVFSQYFFGILENFSFRRNSLHWFKAIIEMFKMTIWLFATPL